jgi:hypothetical protein
LKIKQQIVRNLPSAFLAIVVGTPAFALPAISDPIMLGYFMPTSGVYGPNYFDPKFNKGYNAVVTAFIQIDCATDKKCLLRDQYGMMPEDIAKNVIVAKKNGLKYAMASFTWQGIPADFNVGSSDDAHLSTIARTIITYLKDAHLDGVDFDLEASLSLIPQGTWNGDTLHKLILELRKIKPEIIVTCAPQLSKNAQGKHILVTSGISQDYDKAIELGDFDYIIVQAALGLPEEANADIVANTYNWLTASDAVVKIPQKTKLLIDVLSGPNVNQINSNTVWYNCKSCDDVYAKLAKSYESISGESQFGGAATWSMNHDANKSYGMKPEPSSDWKWVTTILPAINGTIPKQDRKNR